MNAEEDDKPLRVLLASPRPHLAVDWLEHLAADTGIAFHHPPADNGGQLAQALCNGHRPDVLLLDQTLLERLDTIELTTLHAQLDSLRVLLLCDESGATSAATVLRHRFHGYLPVQCPPELCAKAIRSVSQGEIWLPRALLTQVLEELLRLQPSPPLLPAGEPPQPLTRRERQIVEHLRRGSTNKEIAQALGIMEDTVKKHLQSVFAKLGVHRRALVAMHPQ